MSKIGKTQNRLQARAGSQQLSFLPEPDFNPELPPKNTLTFCALSLLLQNKEITHLDFQLITSSWRLAAYICELKKLGWPVLADEVTHAVSNDPTARSICRYSLDKKIIKKF